MKYHCLDIVLIDRDRDGTLNGLVDGPLRENFKFDAVLATEKSCFNGKIKVLKRLSSLDFSREFFDPGFQASLIKAEIAFLGGIQVILNLPEDIRLSLI